MDYEKLDTNHNKFNEDLYSDKPSNNLNDEYTYTGEEIEATLKDFDENTMNVTGNKGTNAGKYTITVTPKDKWKDGSKESVEISWEIKKADPIVETPKLSAKAGTKLKDIKLPENFKWNNPEEVLSKDNNMFYITYVPTDTTNYNTLDVFVTIEIKKEKIKEVIRENTKVEEDKDVEEETPTPEEEPTKEDNKVEEKEPTKFKEENNSKYIWIISIIVLISVIVLGIIKYKNSK